MISGFPHHITQRGNHREAVFETDEDRALYLDLLCQYARKHSLQIWAYCLMTNHVHIVAAPGNARAIALSLRDTHRLYARQRNRNAGVTGHVWQGRFFSCVLDDRHLWTAVRYVERNPVRAGMVPRAEEFRWSSAPAHCGQARDPLLAPGFPPPGVVRDWARWLAAPDDDVRVAALRRETLTGRPCGSEDFLEHIESTVGRTVRRKTSGRQSRNGSG